jgi:hypothetical protein
MSIIADSNYRCELNYGCGFHKCKNIVPVIVVAICNLKLSRQLSSANYSYRNIQKQWRPLDESYIRDEKGSGG